MLPSVAVALQMLKCADCEDVCQVKHSSVTCHPGCARAALPMSHCAIMLLDLVLMDTQVIQRVF